MIRKPVVSGSFYDQDSKRLNSQIQRWMQPFTEKGAEAWAALVPHAGYVYSGAIAAQTLAQVQPVSTIFLLGPNHTGVGEAVAVDPSEAWQTPLGIMSVDHEAAAQLVDQCVYAQWDDLAHQNEHSLEVIVPFLQARHLTEQIVPVCIGTLELPVLEALGQALARSIATSPMPTMIVVSSDMNHFADLEATEQLDQMALDELLRLDPRRLLQVVRAHHISMCGIAPAAVMLLALSALGPARARLVRHGTSAEAYGDRQRVVGYAGVIIEKQKASGEEHHHG